MFNTIHFAFAYLLHTRTRAHSEPGRTIADLEPPFRVPSASADCCWLLCGGSQCAINGISSYVCVGVSECGGSERGMHSSKDTHTHTHNV